MTLKRMEHVGIVVDDLGAATGFFAELGLVLLGEGAVEGRSVDRVVGLEGVRTEVAMVQTPDGDGRLGLVTFHSPAHEGDNRPAPANAPGIRHIAFAVEDIDAVVDGLRDRGAELVSDLEGSHRCPGEMGRRRKRTTPVMAARPPHRASRGGVYRRRGLSAARPRGACPISRLARWRSTRRPRP
jgi:catechol 2,3-dioxygenase-like lactoylglutathione lyase family enzyme